MNDYTNSMSPLVYNEKAIHQSNEMLSLTDMWRAAAREGEDPDPQKQPAKWRGLISASEFVEHVGLVLGKNEDELFAVTRGGRGGAGSGTLAHWQIGLAYAKYLSPEFHMWCNTVVRERMMGRVPDTYLPPAVLEMVRRTDGIARMLSHKVTEMEKTNVAMMTALATIASIVQPAHPIIVRHGKTAGQIWHAAGYPPIKITSWFGNRLAKFGCQIIGRGEGGMTRFRLFDPDKAEVWLKEGGGELLVRQKIVERQGQGKLRLVQTAPKFTAVNVGSGSVAQPSEVP
jgi:hypothetical protein